MEAWILTLHFCTTEMLQFRASDLVRQRSYSAEDYGMTYHAPKRVSGHRSSIHSKAFNDPSNARKPTMTERPRASRNFRPGQSVLVQQGNNWRPTKITEKLQEPRSYRLEDGLRRTSFHLRPADAEREENPRVDEHPESEPLEQTPIPTGTELEIDDDYVDKQSSTHSQTESLRRSTRRRKKPDRYGY